MVRSEKAALTALHHIFVRARFLAAKNDSKLVGLLDNAEILPLMLASTEDETERFSACLKDIAERFPFCGALHAEYLQALADEPREQAA